VHIILGWGSVALFLIINFFLLLGRAPTWEDEVFAQSTAWSIVHGSQPNLSVIAMYPYSISPERFYGPVSFQVAADLEKMFGLQTWPWRMVCFLFGISLMVLSSALILRFVGAGRWVVLAGASAVELSSVYCSSLPGRWDPVTVGLLLSGIALLLHAARSSWKKLAWQACCAGILFGLAVGSTPRALPSLAGVVCGLLAGMCLEASKRSRLMVASLVAGILAVVVDGVLLATIGMTPWNWLRFAATSSKGDRINSSPLLGGSWGLDVANNKVVLILAMALLILGLIFAVRQRRAGLDTQVTWRVALTVMALANMAVDGLLLSRAISVAIFWLPLLTVSSLCWLDPKFARGSKVDFLIQFLLCLVLLLPGVLDMKRVYSAVKLWKSRDPQILLTEIKENIPAGSIVFGPVGGYFFPVEQSGSRYLYLNEQTTPGLSLGADSPAYRQRSIDFAACVAPTFVVWPRDQPGSPLPDEVVNHHKTQLHPRQAGFVEDPIIYRVEGPANCAAIGAHPGAIKAFGPL